MTNISIAYQLITQLWQLIWSYAFRMLNVVVEYVCLKYPPHILGLQPSRDRCCWRDS